MTSTVNDHDILSLVRFKLITIKISTVLVSCMNKLAHNLTGRKSNNDSIIYPTPVTRSLGSSFTGTQF